MSYSNPHAIETGINPDAKIVQLSFIEMVTSASNYPSDYIDSERAKWAPIIKKSGAIAE